ncbi:MAG TPA: helix-turn-helix transcriptional regulator [Microthrixaceae bacterium]|nr:helix-turn-helix transcriptional regulator [Microthrixaceae bacterium]
MELLVPPRRLGRLLSEARLEKGLTVAEVSEEMGGSLDEIDLLEIETGRRAISESDLKTLSELYGVRTSSMVPSRSQLVIDLDEGLITADGSRTELPDHDTAAGREEVLSKYLALVYSMRGQEPGTTVTLRLGDLDVLAEALDSDRRTVEDELLSLMVARPEPVKKRFRLLRGRTVVPVVGVLVASTTAGALVFDVDDSSAATPTPGVEEPAALAPSAELPRVIIDDAAFQERMEDGSPGPVQVRLGDASDSTPAGD